MDKKKYLGGKKIMYDNTNYLTEEKIRPKRFDRMIEYAYKKDLIWLLKKSKGFRKVNCPACQSKKKKKLFIKNSFKYNTCLTCNTSYISPRPTLKILENFYFRSEGYKAWSKYTFKASEKSRVKNLIYPRIKLIKNFIKKYKIKNNLALEIGPGYGTYSSILKKKKFFKKVKVVEANKDLIESCKKKNLIVEGGSFENIKFNEKFDLVSSFEVIEHSFSPKNFLRKIYKILSQNSLVFISCPNVQGFDNAVLGKDSSTFDHEHLNYFNPDSIKILFRKNKFKILYLSTPGKLDVDLVRNYAKKNKNFINKDSFLYQILLSKNVKLRKNFQNFLYNNCLSGHMLIIAKKN
jgi:2-polyprenyl-3-methyl-5-hydroxy-6-metoxy-1,4-benzoquinol methylase